MIQNLLFYWNKLFLKHYKFFQRKIGHENKKIIKKKKTNVNSIVCTCTAHPYIPGT